MKRSSDHTEEQGTPSKQHRSGAESPSSSQTDSVS